MPKPPPVDNPKRFINDVPAVHSARAKWLLQRIESGAWTPRRSLIWPEQAEWAVHQELGVYRAEWFHLLLPAACTQYAAKQLAKVITLPGCPTAQPTPWWSRWEDDDLLREVCLCPDEPGRLPRVHWLNWRDRRLLHCQCGPKFVGSGFSDGNHNGYICRECSSHLRDGLTPFARNLVCDMPCCYCGGIAKGGSPWAAGYRLTGHPPLAEESANRRENQR